MIAGGLVREVIPPAVKQRGCSAWYFSLQGQGRIYGQRSIFPLLPSNFQNAMEYVWDAYLYVCWPFLDPQIGKVKWKVTLLKTTGVPTV
jgi:hypothetical protein